MIDIDYPFCSICGRSFEDKTNEEGNMPGRYLDFTLINGSYVCRDCWENEEGVRQQNLKRLTSR